MFSRKGKGTGTRETGGPAVHEGKPFGSPRTSLAQKQGPARDFSRFCLPGLGVHSEAGRMAAGEMRLQTYQPHQKSYSQSESPRQQFGMASFGPGSAFYSLNLNFPISTMKDLDQRISILWHQRILKVRHEREVIDHFAQSSYFTDQKGVAQIVEKTCLSHKQGIGEPRVKI